MPNLRARKSRNYRKRDNMEPGRTMNVARRMGSGKRNSGARAMRNKPARDR